MNWRAIFQPIPLTESVFLRTLGVVYVMAFGSLLPQILGLMGHSGITPAYRLLAAVKTGMSSHAFIAVPTLFWINCSDAALVTGCVAGCVCGLAMLLGFWTRIAALVCWVLYLSVSNVGQPWTGFQWDALLVESGFLALFASAPMLSWAYRFLLFRLMFESGIVKLQSHDPTWRSLHALRFHFFTQPLPNPIAFHAQYLPDRVLDFLTGATLLIELVIPFLLFGPRIVRYAGVAILATLQICILLTGNYAFFNFLTLALCLWGLEDRAFRWLPIVLQHPVLKVPRYPAQVALSIGLGFLMLFGAVKFYGVVNPWAEFREGGLLSKLAPFELVNDYGLFASMTTTRPEVVMEGSNDLSEWREYSFRYKPGALDRALPVVAPHQPRLDWQMWFAALSPYQANTWIASLMYRLLTGEVHVTHLLEPAPFPKPPRYMRALLYDYRFTTPTERAQTHAIWKRSLLGTYYGPVSLSGQ